MTIERIVFSVGGFFVLLSLALGAPASPIFVSEYWLWLTAFVGFTLFQSGFTGICPMSLLLKKIGFSSTAN